MVTQLVEVKSIGECKIILKEGEVVPVDEGYEVTLDNEFILLLANQIKDKFNYYS